MLTTIYYDKDATLDDIDTSVDKLIKVLTHSLTYLLTHSLTYLLTYSLTYFFIVC